MNQSSNKEKPHSDRRARWMWIALVVGLFIAMLGVSAYFLESIAEVAHRRNRMTSVLSWLLNDRVDGDISSPEGSLLSWRTIALWKNAPLPPEPDRRRAWNASSNKILSEREPQWFCDRGNPHTRLVAVRGKDTVFDTSIGEFIKVGRSESDAIVLVELHADTFVWSQPGDLATGVKTIVNWRTGLPHSVLTNQANDYFVGFADGSTWLISRDTPFTTIRPFLTISGAAKVDRNESLAPYRIGR